MSSIQELKDIIKYCKDEHKFDPNSPCPYLLRSFCIDQTNMTIKEVADYENKLRIAYYEEQLAQMLQKQ